MMGCCLGAIFWRANWPLRRPLFRRRFVPVCKATVSYSQHMRNRRACEHGHGIERRDTPALALGAANRTRSKPDESLVAQHTKITRCAGVPLM